MPKRGPAVLRGRGLRSLGAIEVSAPFLGTDRPLRLLGHVESSTGTIREEGHPLDGQSFAGRVFAFPRGIGSTVAPYVLVEARLHGALPAAILLGSSRDHGTIAAARLKRSTPPALSRTFSPGPIGSAARGKSASRRW